MNGAVFWGLWWFVVMALAISILLRHSLMGLLMGLLIDHRGKYPSPTGEILTPKIAGVAVRVAAKPLQSSILATTVWVAGEGALVEGAKWWLLATVTVPRRC